MTEYTALEFVHSWLDTNQAKPPKEPGVYFIYYSSIGGFGPFCELLYIGSTNNLHRRLSSHKIIKEYSAGVFRITYYITNDFRRLEKLAVERFAPLANINLQKKY